MMVRIPDQSGSSLAYCDHEPSDPGTVVPRRGTGLRSSTKAKRPATRHQPEQRQLQVKSVRLHSQYLRSILLRDNCPYRPRTSYSGPNYRNARLGCSNLHGGGAGIMLAIAKRHEMLRRTKPPIRHSFSVMECSLTRHDGDALLASCLTNAIYLHPRPSPLRWLLHSCWPHRPTVWPMQRPNGS